MKTINPDHYEAVLHEVTEKILEETPSGCKLFTNSFNLVKNAFLSRPSTAFEIAEDGRTHAEEFMEHYIRMAHIIIFNMRGTYREAALCFIVPALKYEMVTDYLLRGLSVDLYEDARHIAFMVSEEKKSGNSTAIDTDQLITKHIYHLVCDNLFHDIKRKLNPGRSGMVEKAYRLAKDAHQNQYRDTGEPYITHPIMVADILAGMNTESEIVAACLLHDVIEDCDEYGYDDIARQIGKTVADYVNSVTSFDREYDNIVGANPESADKSKDKADIDRITVSKLKRIVRENDEMIFALYIKAADRIHNLKTIDGMDVDKKNKKVEETKNRYIPLFRHFKLIHFVGIIEDQCWRIVDPERYEKIRCGYTRLLYENKTSTDFIWDKLYSTFERNMETYYRRFFNDGFYIEFRRREYLPYEIFSLLKKKTESFHQIHRMITKQNMPLMAYEVILDSKNPSYDLSTFIQIFMEIYREVLAPEKCIITDYSFDKRLSRYEIALEDEYHNVILLHFCFRNDYYTFIYGSTRGFAEPDYQKNKDGSDGIGETITVKKKNGESVELPTGATVLDFAFAIHQEMGLSARSAVVNGRESGIYTLLQDGDYVVVNSDTSRENGVTKNHVDHARIDWLNHVVTDDAKLKITRYLESKYEGQNPFTENNARPKIVSAISNHIYNTNAAVFKSIAND